MRLQFLQINYKGCIFNMFKRILCLLLCLALSLGILAMQAGAAVTEQNAAVAEISAMAAELSATVSEISAAVTEAGSDPQDADLPVQDSIPYSRENPRILVDGVVLEDTPSLLINGTTYVALRGVGQALRPDAVISWEDRHAVVTADDLTITAYPNESYFVANGRYLYLPDGVKLINGTTMLPVRKLAQALGAEVDWDAETSSVLITSGTGTIVSGDEYYDADVLDLVSHIIYAESGNQPLAGKIAVGNVIFNRVNDPLFPNTVSAVIYQPNQFYPVGHSIFYKTPNAESVIAAKLCMDGAMVLPTALYFNGVGRTCWASQHKTCVAVIGGHAFYG